MPSVGARPSKDRAERTSAHNQSYNWFLNKGIRTESQLIVEGLVHFLDMFGDRVQETAFRLLEVEVVGRLSEPHLAERDLIGRFQRSVPFDCFFGEFLAVDTLGPEGEILSRMFVSVLDLDIDGKYVLIVHFEVLEVAAIDSERLQRPFILQSINWFGFYNLVHKTIVKLVLVDRAEIDVHGIHKFCL